MKILIIGVGYQCPDLDATITPWVEAQNRHNIDIVFSSALFKERQESGETFNNEENELILSKYKSVKYIKTTDPILEPEVRNRVLSSVSKKEYDFFWQVDFHDEYYLAKEIDGTISFLENDRLTSYHRINFKNFFGRIEDGTYVLDFKPVRILNNRVHGGVNKFYWHNDVNFGEPLRTPFTSGSTIPTKICNPRHLSWVGSEEHLKKKIAYQHKAMGACSYKWDDNLKTAVFDFDYYKKFNVPVPKIYKD